MTQIIKRQSELKKEIEEMNELWSNDSMPNETFDYFNSLKDELNYVNLLIAHPEYA